MRLIPVIDILNGIVVHAVRGKRKAYQPLKSVLCKSVDPVEVARAFKLLGFEELYVADLDAITSGHVNYDVLRRIQTESGLQLRVDAAVSNLETAQKTASIPNSKIIIGTETLTNKDFVKEAVKIFGADKIIVSLDLMGDNVLVGQGFEGCKTMHCLLKQFSEMNVYQIIVLDLARVGSGEGVNLDLLKKLKTNFDFSLFVGGGVRNVEDLKALKKLGVSGVLLATALHSGKISLEELKTADLF